MPAIRVKGDVSADVRGWERLLSKVKGLDKKYIKVGIIAEKGGGEMTEDGMTLAELGALHEYGGKNVPERSWLRRTFEEKGDLVKEKQAEICKMIVMDKTDVRKGLEMLGAWAAAETKKTITHGEPIPPPNAPSTIARKGSDRPLVDTGRMVGAISYEVVDE